VSSGPLNLGVVGAGTLSKRVLVHLSMADVAQRARVVHICDPVSERATALARTHGVPRTSATLDELLADPDVHAVTIASPIGLHYEHVRAALAAGKHVHVNKTLAVTTAEATELIAAAGEAGLALVSSPGEVLRPHVQRTRQLIADGAIGTATWAVCGAALGTYHENEPERQASGAEAIDPSWYFRLPGGGPLYDMTVYALHGLTAVLGSVRRVTALSGIRISERSFGGRTVPTEADDNTIMLLDFGDALFAVAYGTSAGILTEDSGWDPDARYYGTRGELVEGRLNGEPMYDDVVVSLVGGEKALLPHVGPDHAELLESHVFADIMQMVDLALDGTPTLVTAEHARHVIEIIEAAYRAASTGAAQELTTTVTGLTEKVGAVAASAVA
jgi:predicted dehydrogenase